MVHGPCNNYLKISHHINRLKGRKKKIIHQYFSRKAWESENQIQKRKSREKKISLSCVASAGEELRCGQSDKLGTLWK